MLLRSASRAAGGVWGAVTAAGRDVARANGASSGWGNGLGAELHSHLRPGCSVGAVRMRSTSLADIVPRLAPPSTESTLRTLHLALSSDCPSRVYVPHPHSIHAALILSARL
jgi:hypothetical protein